MVSAGKRDAVRRGLWDEQQHLGLVLGLKPFNDVGARPSRNGAVYGLDLVGVAEVCDELLVQRLQHMPKRHEHQYLVRGPVNDVQQLGQPRLHVELHHFPSVGVDRALANLKQLVEHARSVGRGNLLAGCKGHHLLFDGVVILLLLRGQRHFAGGDQLVRQVQALFFGEPNGGL